jgi:hypothetical protein
VTREVGMSCLSGDKGSWDFGETWCVRLIMSTSCCKSFLVANVLSRILFISWEFCNYSEPTFELLKVVTKKWESNVPFVKATNLRLLHGKCL